MSESGLIKCRYCFQDIDEKSLVCHHCGKDQRGYVNKIKDFASVTTLVMVGVAVVQVLVNYSQMQELKIKRIDAEKVLEKANHVFSNASTISNKAIEKSSNVLTIAEENAMSAKAVTAKATREMKNTVGMVDKQLNASNKRINKTEKGLILAKAEFSAQLEVLRKRNELMVLGDKALSGERKAYIKLLEMADKDNAALAEIFRVQSFYQSCDRIPKVLELKDKAGIVFKNLSIPTIYLIDALLNNPDWRIRGGAANLLGYRKEKTVPLALIESMKNENELDVLQASINAFSRLTGYRDVYVLEPLPTIKWWRQNEIRIAKDFEWKSQ